MTPDNGTCQMLMGYELALRRPLWPRERRNRFRIVGSSLNSIREKAEQNLRSSGVREGRNPRSPGRNLKVDYSGKDTTEGNSGLQRKGHHIGYMKWNTAVRTPLMVIVENSGGGHHNGNSNVDNSGEDTTAGRYIIVGIVDGVEVQFEICVNKNSAGEGQGV